jgi:hypothetical protein
MYRWNRGKQGWTIVAGVHSALTVGVGPEDKPWFVSTDGGILASDLFEEKSKPRTVKAKASGAKSRTSLAVAVTSHEPLSFVRVSGYAQQVAIGTQGSVFITGQDGKLARWSELSKAFVEFPGVLSRIAVDPQGRPWGLSGGLIYHFDGSRWNLISGTATDIAVGYDGTVMIADAQHRLYRYSPDQNRFWVMPSQFQGSQIAVAPRGNPWTIREDHSIYRCSQEGCVRTPLEGSSIAIGPDGSVFMTGLDQHLYRWDAAHLTWALIDTPIAVADVAVGPFGRPWVVDKNGEIYASRFFHRDERNDAAETAVAAYQSSSSPVSTFTFTKSLVFIRVAFPAGKTLTDIHVGANGRVYVDTPDELYRYDSQARRFALDPVQSGGASQHSGTAETNGRLWIASGYYCFRQATLGGATFEEPWLEGGVGQDICYDLAVGANDSVFAAIRPYPGIGNGNLYRYNETKHVFTLFSDVFDFTYSHVAVSPDGDPWVITSDNKLWRYDGKQFVAVAGFSKLQIDNAKRIAIGPTGAVYLVTTSAQLYKWNNTNQSFDRVNRNEVSKVAVDADGRPWIISSGNMVFRAQ